MGKRKGSSLEGGTAARWAKPIPFLSPGLRKDRAPWTWHCWEVHREGWEPGRLEHMGRGHITGPGSSQSSWEQAALERRGAGDRRAQGSLGSGSASRARAQRPAETWHTTGGVSPQSLENEVGGWSQREREL